MWGAELGVSATPTGWAGPVISCCCRRPRYPAGPGCGGLGVGGYIMGNWGFQLPAAPEEHQGTLMPHCAPDVGGGSVTKGPLGVMGPEGRRPGDTDLGQGTWGLTSSSVLGPGFPI